MTRDVNCYITNTSTFGYGVQGTDIRHGHTRMAPKYIEPNSTQTEVFAYEKTSGSMQGTSGIVTYQLQDSNTLVITFNCPFTADGQQGQSNCFFYAGICNVTTGSQYSLDVTVKIGNNPMNPQNPPTADTINAYITINMANDPIIPPNQTK